MHRRTRDIGEKTEIGKHIEFKSTLPYFLRKRLLYGNEHQSSETHVQNPASRAVMCDS